MTAMYAHLLASTLGDWVDELTGTALTDYTLVCRAEMLAATARRGETSATRLAAEITYDRALCKLSENKGIAIDAMAFSHPAQARVRLETELAAAGIDLAALSRQRRSA
jgi:hypothetical protein